MDNTSTTFVLSDITYNRMKKLVQLILPAISTLYFTLGNIWGFPKIEQVVGTIAALMTFLGVVLGVSNKQYKNADYDYDGVLNVIPPVLEDEKIKYSFELNDRVESLLDKDELRFKVLSQR